MDDNNHHPEIWIQALKLCEKYQHLDINEAINAINKLNVDPLVQIKALNIISRLHEEHSMFDDNNISSVLEKINAQNNLVGTTINDYKLTHLIAKGGMSSIYKANKIDSNSLKAWIQNR